MGGGKSSSSSSTTSNATDNRVVADGNGIANGAGGSLTYNYTQGLDETAAKLVEHVLSTVGDIASGAGGAVNKALDTTKSVAERQQTTTSANGISDALKSPALIIGAVALAGMVLLKGSK